MNYKIIYTVILNKKYQLFDVDSFLYWAVPSINYCSKMNPNCEINIITDFSELKNIFNSDKIIIHSLDDYKTDDIAWVSQNYIHLSTNPYQFELNSIIRFFYLRNFCKKNQIFDFFYNEPDVLVFSDVIEDNKNIKSKNYVTTLIHGLGGGVNFIDNNIGVLEKFCEIVVNTYSNPQISPYAFQMDKQIICHDNNIKNNIPAGGVCDMYFWMWYKNNKDNVLKDMDINDNGIFLQTCIHMGMNDPIYGLYKWKYEWCDKLSLNIKTLNFENNKCFGEYENEKVQIKYLHFHGNRKLIIPDILEKIK